MKKTDFKTKNEGELHKLLAEKREAVRAFRFGTSGSRTKNVKVGHNNKKDIARILTALNAVKK
jgi:ribosomal protein L29